MSTLVIKEWHNSKGRVPQPGEYSILDKQLVGVRWIVRGYFTPPSGGRREFVTSYNLQGKRDGGCAVESDRNLYEDFLLWVREERKRVAQRIADDDRAAE